MNNKFELNIIEFKHDIAERLDLDFSRDIFDLKEEVSDIIFEKQEILEFNEKKLISINKLSTEGLENVKYIECYYIEISDKEDCDEYTYIVFDNYIEAREFYDNFIKTKTMEDWKQSDANYFNDFCKPGDLVGQDIVDYFVNSITPILLSDRLVQAGEAYSSRIDPEDNKYKSTYITFERMDNGWVFRGNCFKNKNYDVDYQYQENEEENEDEDLEQ